jgi:hypothetical protein
MVIGDTVLLTYKDALAQFGSRHHVRKAVGSGKLSHVARGIYSTDRNNDFLSTLLKKYSLAIVTGQTAYYLHDLSDVIPDKIDLATKRGGTVISDNQVNQHFIPNDWLNVGKTTIKHSGSFVRVYDKERMLIELIRNRNKMPYDIYKNIVETYRKHADTIDIYKLQDYVELIPRGQAYLNTIMKEVF